MAGGDVRIAKLPARSSDAAVAPPGILNAVADSESAQSLQSLVASMGRVSATSTGTAGSCFSTKVASDDANGNVVIGRTMALMSTGR
jgi:hypothetical protein